MDDFPDYFPEEPEPFWSGVLQTEDPPIEQPSDEAPRWFDNGDGTFTDTYTGEVWEGEEVIGYDLGNGNWVDNNGNVFDTWNNAIGQWAKDGIIFYRDGTTDTTPVYVPPINIGSEVQSDQTPGFLGWLKNLFSGSGGTSAGQQGGGSSSSSGSTRSQQQQQAQQREQDLQRQIQQARQAGASSATIAAMQRELLATQQVMAGLANGDQTKAILIAAVATLGVLALVNRRRD